MKLLIAQAVVHVVSVALYANMKVTLFIYIMLGLSLNYLKHFYVQRDTKKTSSR